MFVFVPGFELRLVYRYSRLNRSNCTRIKETVSFFAKPIYSKAPRSYRLEVLQVDELNLSQITPKIIDTNLRTFWSLT